MIFPHFAQRCLSRWGLAPTETVASITKKVHVRARAPPRRRRRRRRRRRKGGGGGGGGGKFIQS